MIKYTLTLTADIPGHEPLRAKIESTKPVTADMENFLFITLTEHATQIIAFGTNVPEWECEKLAEQSLAEAIEAAKKLAHLPGIEDVLASLRIANRHQRARREAVGPDGIAAFIAEGQEPPDRRSA